LGLTSSLATSLSRTTAPGSADVDLGSIPPKPQEESDSGVETAIQDDHHPATANNK